jgi:hypothetical protein
MNTESQTATSGTKSKSKPANDYIRIKRETKKKILSDLAQINRKDFGKSITPDQYIALAISLLTPEHLEQLKTQSMTNKDRLELKYREHCSTNGKVSMDEFIGMLLQERKPQFNTARENL